MKSKYNKVTCLFGHHDYSKKLTKDKHGRPVYMCKICKRSGWKEWNDGDEAWFDYNEEGNCVHENWGDGDERWLHYDEKGVHVHTKWNHGEEYWKNNYGHWVRKKPENWKYEKYLQ